MVKYGLAVRGDEWHLSGSDVTVWHKDRTVLEALHTRLKGLFPQLGALDVRVSTVKMTFAYWLNEAEVSPWGEYYLVVEDSGDVQAVVAAVRKEMAEFGVEEDAVRNMP